MPPLPQPPGHWRFWRHLVVTTWGRGTGIWWVAARDSANAPHRAAPHKEDFSSSGRETRCQLVQGSPAGAAFILGIRCTPGTLLFKSRDSGISILIPVPTQPASGQSCSERRVCMFSRALWKLPGDLFPGAEACPRASGQENQGPLPAVSSLSSSSTLLLHPASRQPLQSPRLM